MPTPALPRRATAAAGLACLAALTLTGCSGDGADASDRPVTRASGSPSEASPSAEEPSPAETTDAAPSESPDPTPPEPSESPAGGDGLQGRLLSAGEVPGFNQEYRWTKGGTSGSEPEEPFGTCQRFSMTSVGATDVAVRDFRPATAGAEDSAGELVAEFPDSMTARRAFEVLKSWRAKCASRLEGYDRADVGRLEGVDVPGGTGGWYLLSYGPVPGDPDAGYFDAQGIALVGSRIAMVELVAVGQDYNYEPGQEPAVAAVQRAAARLS
jgi:hypothetical protein